MSDSWEPINVDEADGPIYVLTHAREFDRKQWTRAAVSCLMGEQGPEARELVHRIARHYSITIGPES